MSYILYIIILILATALLGYWAYLLMNIQKEDWLSAGYNKIVDNIIKINSLKAKALKNNETLKKYNGLKLKLLQILYKDNSIKKINKLQEENMKIQSGNFKAINIIHMPGYVILRNFNLIGKGEIHKTLMIQSYELYGKKYAEYKTKGLIASMVSYLLLGIGISIILGVILMSQGRLRDGLIILIVGIVIVLVWTYGIYTEVSEEVNKRRNAIERQFPNMVSKLALLVTSGMVINRAWKETAYSNDSELYMEMQTTSEELDNLVSPEIAYSNFIKRCNTKETAKIASAIIQSMSKGNSELGILLREMAKEAWIERRHLAKRDSERANAKLMIPTMLLLLTVIVMIMVPIANSFNSF